MSPHIVDDDDDVASVVLRIDSRDSETGVDRKHLKFADDGVTVLVPQPNGDPNNPVWKLLSTLSSCSGN